MKIILLGGASLNRSFMSGSAGTKLRRRLNSGNRGVREAHGIQSRRRPPMRELGGNLLTENHRNQNAVDPHDGNRRFDAKQKHAVYEHEFQEFGRPPKIPRKIEPEKKKIFFEKFST